MVAAYAFSEEGIANLRERFDRAGLKISDLEQAGFELLERSDLLAVPDDEYSEMGFPSRWNEDRMVFKSRKPPAR